MSNNRRFRIKNEPLISVCIPTSNSANFIYKALHSVVHQSYPNLEIIIVDNYSDDNTVEIINSFKDPRVKVLNKRNYGSIAASRNCAILNARSEWIAFLDSDDYWELNKIQECSRYLQLNYEFIYHNLKIVDSSDEKTGGKIKSKTLRNPIFENLLIKGNTIATSSVLVRKDLLQKVGYMNENLLLAGTEDYNTWLKISLLTERFKRINKTLGTYRIHEKNFSIKKDMQPPWEAIKEFRSKISPQISKLIELNYAYSSVRMKYLNDRNSVTNLELFKLMIDIKGVKKFKILIMIIAKWHFFS
jgi:glycosyltransferase involved in cell wall biosynthesis